MSVPLEPGTMCMLLPGIGKREWIGRFVTCAGYPQRGCMQHAYTGLVRHNVWYIRVKAPWLPPALDENKGWAVETNCLLPIAGPSIKVERTKSVPTWELPVPYG